MKHIIRKAYWNYEKEEKWLNELSAKGMALSDYSWCRYVFEETPNNEYIYRIELLGKSATHPESVAYIKFLEENSVECVATYMRWIYLRKKSIEGEFDIYSDIESKIKHYKRISSFWSVIMALEFSAGFANVFIGIINKFMSGDANGDPYLYINIMLGLVLIALGILFSGLKIPIAKKINKLRKEKTIRE